MQALRPTRIGYNTGDIVFHIVNYLGFAIFTFICIYPFYYILVYSLSSPDQAAIGTYFYPMGITLNNYYTLLASPGISKAALISVGRTVIGTLASVICTTMLGYLVTQKQLPMRKIIYRFIVMTMYINAGLIPYYILLRNLSLINSFWVYVIPGLIGAFNMILIKTYIEQLPASMEESAMVDGASYLRIFFSIIIPLSMPIIATVTVFNAVGQWNSFSDTLIFCPGGKLDTLQMKLYTILQTTSQAFVDVRTDWIQDNPNVIAPTPTTIRMTITMIATLPILFIYPFMQRFFVKGIMLGATKG